MRADPRRDRAPGGGSPSTATTTSTASARPRSWSRALRELGADCDWLIPDRLGGRLRARPLATVERLAERGTGLLITVDCGIASVDEVAAARAAGHRGDRHRPPPARRASCPTARSCTRPLDGYPFAELCATGVAYKLAAALASAAPRRPSRDLDLVALATVADLVPLRGENRSLVRRGLEVARRARAAGAAGADGGGRGSSPSDSTRATSPSGSAPRINAAGRLYRADAGVELMLTDDDGARGGDRRRARARQPRAPRRPSARSLAAAEAALRELPDGARAMRPALVLAGEGWHPGVVGIVASRLVERHDRPGRPDRARRRRRRARGSGRSIPGFDLLAALRRLRRAPADRYGGHRAAAGLEIEAGRRRRLPRRLRRPRAATRSAAAEPRRTEVVDAVVGGESLGLERRRAARGAWRRSGWATRACGCWCPAARVGDVRPMGEERQARPLQPPRAAPARALGVAFGVNGALAAAPSDEPARRLGPARAQPLERRGRAARRARRRSTRRARPTRRGPRASRRATRSAPTSAGAASTPSSSAALGPWPPRVRPARPGHGAAGRAPRRRRRRRRSPRWRRAASRCSRSAPTRPAPRAGGERGAPGPLRRRRARPRLGARSPTPSSRRPRPGSRWPEPGWCSPTGRRWPGDPALAGRFEHVVLVDPPPFAHLEALVRRRSRLAAPRRRARRGRVRAACARRRVAVASLARRRSTATLIAAGAGASAARQLRGAAVRRRACPPALARDGRPLRRGSSVELGLVGWNGAASRSQPRGRILGRTELERSAAFVAYRRCSEEGRRFLSERRQS